jgi:hypothetical protein
MAGNILPSRSIRLTQPQASSSAITLSSKSLRLPNNAACCLLLNSHLLIVFYGTSPSSLSAVLEACHSKHPDFIAMCDDGI